MTRTPTRTTRAEKARSTRRGQATTGAETHTNTHSLTHSLSRTHSLSHSQVATLAGPSANPGGWGQARCRHQQGRHTGGLESTTPMAQGQGENPARRWLLAYLLLPTAFLFSLSGLPLLCSALTPRLSASGEICRIFPSMAPYPLLPSLLTLTLHFATAEHDLITVSACKSVRPHLQS